MHETTKIAVVDSSLVVEALVPSEHTEAARRTLEALATTAAMLAPQRSLPGGGPQWAT
ncbi:hypothetical protein Pyrfu_1267 [Pyrolobus fumarii 1A]|uniref:Uncharacterized protein n=1 Tax=Pyrolobus fumarii (strain DSM 11204 / 1A) TaxID=694429 RepID=G0EGA1_PYRF1|nr:hypothetical protein [Pyrolobus fumarii]AEM39126.1 hypothetical protein Pyrfu_1267 [Pyrolobus fumarii 1A]